VVVPAAFVDASRFRDVPDNQECFVDDADRVIAIELLECGAGAALEEGMEAPLAPAAGAASLATRNPAVAAFMDLSRWNDAASYAVERAEARVRPDAAPGLADGVAAAVRFDFTSTCVGTHHNVVKFREADPVGNDVRVWVAVARSAALNCDLVLSVTVPIRVSAASSTAARSEFVDPALGETVFADALRTLRIVNRGLFA